MSTLPEVRLAILYEKDTFGESAAVAAVNDAMNQKLKIGFYGSFEPVNPNLNNLKLQAEEIANKNIHLIYLISNEPQTAIQLVKALRENIPADEIPILLGQSGAFASQEFLNAPEAQNMLILRQKIISDHCPSKFLIQAESYASIELLNYAIQKAKSDAGNVYTKQTIAQKRDAVRNVLKETSNKTVSCLGVVSFDNTGQNTNLDFELLKVTSGGFISIEADDLKSLLTTVYNRSGFGPGN